MKKAILLLIFPLLLLAKPGRAQFLLKDSIVSCWGFTGTAGYQLPGGDLAKRFGNNTNAGASIFYKTKKNYLFNLQWTYLFSNNLKENGVLDSIATSDGYLIDKEGKFADTRMFERGFTLNVSAGKVFNQVFAPNRNSGLLLMGGVGYLQHKIRIYDNGGRSPQLSGDYIKGYDRLTSGVSFTEFVGWWYMGTHRFVNFYAGFEFVQGITKSRRSWDFDLMRADTHQRTDLLNGFRVGWVIPFYGKNGNHYYY